MFYERYQAKASISLRKRTIIRAYTKYIKGKYDEGTQYDCYQLIQYLLSIGDEQFENEFCTSASDVDSLVRFIDCAWVKDIGQLALKVAVARRMEYSQVGINFSG